MCKDPTTRSETTEKLPDTDDWVYGHIGSLTSCESLQIPLPEHLVKTPNDWFMYSDQKCYSRDARALQQCSMSAEKRH